MKLVARFFACLIFDRPKVPVVSTQGTFNGRGDYADEWGSCARCGELCHRDMHIFGDGIWRHFEDRRI